VEFKPIRLAAASYNIHSCVGRDGRCDPDRVLAVLREIDADVIGLQEVGHRPVRRLGGDQYAFFVSSTGMHSVAGRHSRYEGAEFGNLLLSRRPVAEQRTIDLTIRGSEPRGAIDAEIDVDGHPLRVLVAHLGLHPAERWRQVNRLAEALREHGRAPVLLMGPSVGCWSGSVPARGAAIIPRPSRPASRSWPWTGSGLCPSGCWSGAARTARPFRRSPPTICRSRARS